MGHWQELWGAKNYNKQRNMATREMNLYPRFCLLLSLSLHDNSKPHSPSHHHGRNPRKGVDSIKPRGPIHAEWCWHRKMHRLPLLRPPRLSQWEWLGWGPTSGVDQDLRTKLGAGSLGPGRHGNALQRPCMSPSETRPSRSAEDPRRTAPLLS